MTTKTKRIESLDVETICTEIKDKVQGEVKMAFIVISAHDGVYTMPMGDPLDLVEGFEKVFPTALIDSREEFKKALGSILIDMFHSCNDSKVN